MNEGVANLKCHMPIMVNIAVHAMRFETGPDFPVKIAGPKRGSGKNLALVIWLFYGLRGGKFKLAYAYNGQCSNFCDDICDWTGVAPGIVLWGRGRGILQGGRENICW